MLPEAQRGLDRSIKEEKEKEKKKKKKRKEKRPWVRGKRLFMAKDGLLCCCCCRRRCCCCRFSSVPRYLHFEENLLKQ